RPADSFLLVLERAATESGAVAPPGERVKRNVRKGSLRAVLWGAGLLLLALAAFRIATVVGWIGVASERPAAPAGSVGAFGFGGPLPVVSVVAEPVRIGAVEEVA